MLQPEEVFCEENAYVRNGSSQRSLRALRATPSIPVGEMKLDVLCLHEQRNIPLTYVVQDQYRIASGTRLTETMKQF